MTAAATPLTPYACTGINPRTSRPCLTVLIEAWAPAGALVRRRCKQCGLWSTITVAAAGAPVATPDYPKNGPGLP